MESVFRDTKSYYDIINMKAQSLFRNRNDSIDKNGTLVIQLVLLSVKFLVEGRLMVGILVWRLDDGPFYVFIV